MFKQRYYKDDHIFYNSTQLAQVRCAFTVLACQYGECTPTPRGRVPSAPQFWSSLLCVHPFSQNYQI